MVYFDNLVNIYNRIEEDINQDNKVKNNLLFENMLGSTAIANKHQIKMLQSQSDSCWGKFKRGYNSVIATLTPFCGHMNYLFHRYDREVQVYFETIRYLIVISFTVFICYLYFIITHLLNSQYTSETLWCKYNIPCVLLYSRITVAERQAYSYSFATMICVIFFLGITRYINFKRLNLNSKLYDREHGKFSQFFFTSWDWSTKARQTYIEKKARLRQLYILGIKESEIMDNGINCNKNCGLYTVRAITCILTIVCMVIYGCLIIFSYFLRNFLKRMNGYSTTSNPLDIVVIF
jgi:hypothetical protein